MLQGKDHYAGRYIAPLANDLIALWTKKSLLLLSSSSYSSSFPSSSSHKQTINDTTRSCWAYLFIYIIHFPPKKQDIKASSKLDLSIYLIKISYQKSLNLDKQAPVKGFDQYISTLHPINKLNWTRSQPVH